MATRLIRLLVVVCFACTLPACCMRNCVPEDLASSRDLIDLCAAPDAHAPASPSLIREVAAEFRRRGGNLHPPGSRPYHFLALSSGGLYGSYGAGVLKGWSDSGTRPAFDGVTGISAGALMATFAFLGPQYDEVLRENLVDVNRRDFLRLRRLVGILPGGSLFSSRPLARQVERVITPQVLAEVAAAHAAGRRLYIGTTNLDSRRLVIWDMGAIASRCTPESAALYRKIVLASSSIPVAFPPVKLQVEIDGVMYDELHADGGVSDEVIFRAFMVTDLNRMIGIPGPAAPPGSTLYLINNGKLYSKGSCVHNLFQIFSTAYKTVLYNKSRDELYRIYLNCLETSVDFHLTAVPEEVEIGSSSLSLSREDQQKLFQAGYQAGLRASSGEGWRTAPPGIEPSEQVLPRAGTHFASNGEGARVARPSPRAGSCPACGK